MGSDKLTVALISDVFFDAAGEARLRERLIEARDLGATLALLPELPLNPWSPATATPSVEDEEEPGGWRHQLLASATASAGVGVIGGAIVRAAESGERHNTALVFDRHGAFVAEYAKVHLPDEDGFREPCHYAPGSRHAEPITQFGLPIGIQICSDINRPQGCHALAAMGAIAILNPRATEAVTFERWKLVFRANALTSCAYVLSVNRPRPEQGVALGGPSIVVDPNGDVLIESLDPVTTVTLDAAMVDRARRRYPGYLATYPGIYARAWSALASRVD